MTKKARKKLLKSLDLKRIKSVRVIKEDNLLKMGMEFDVINENGTYTMQYKSEKRNEAFLRDHLLKGNFAIQVYG